MESLPLNSLGFGLVHKERDDTAPLCFMQKANAGFKTSLIKLGYAAR